MKLSFCDYLPEGDFGIQCQKRPSGAFHLLLKHPFLWQGLHFSYRKITATALATQSNQAHEPDRLIPPLTHARVAGNTRKHK